LLARQIELIGALEVHPEIGRHAEIPAEAKGCIRGHAALSGRALRGKANLLQLVGGDFSG